MNNKKQNCWQFKKCGRQVGGENETKVGVCPVAIEVHLDGVNGGINGGRFCWACAGKNINKYQLEHIAEKIKKCSCCDFYKIVKNEENG